jgi:hypothetical protein
MIPSSFQAFQPRNNEVSSPLPVFDVICHLAPPLRSEIDLPELVYRFRQIITDGEPIPSMLI